HVATASIKKPIHNVKEERNALHITSPWLANRFSSSLEIVRCSAKHRYAVCLVELIGIEPMT
ncbi:hypothetical protein ACFOOJ_12615, partial [Sphingobium xenophagum]